MKNKHFHDNGYKYLFSNADILKQLLESFVKMKWVKETDFKKAEPVEKSFVSKEYKKYESDIIYKLKLKGRDIYLYLLLEFQSTVDPYISLRMLRYVIELYEYLIKNEKVKRLPIVFPVMLYNGDKKWTAQEDINELIEKQKELKEIEPYLPKFQYYKIIENEFTLKELRRFTNVVSTVFELETEEEEEFKGSIERLINKSRYKNSSILKIFIVWVEKFLDRNADIEVIRKSIEPIKKISEVKTMFARKIERWEKELINKGRQEGLSQGIEQGREEGVEQGKIEIIKRMHKRGLTAEAISEYTEIKIEKVKALIKKTLH